MPHLVLKYSDNLIPHVPVDTLLSGLHKKFITFDTIPLEDTKTAALPYSYYQVGSHGRQKVFVHLDILMLKGRPEALRSQIGNEMVAYLQGEIAKHVPAQLPFVVTLEIREMERSNFFKFA